MAGTTTMDALIAELLGDVGKLHAELAALNGALPAMTAGVEHRLGAVVDTLTATSTMLKKQAMAADGDRGAARASLGMLFAAALLSGAIGAGVTLGILRLVAPSTIPGLQASGTYASGRFIERAWPFLDAVTRAKIEVASGARK